MVTETFITSVDLRIPFNDNVFQFLYASQLYGTLFGVYGKFDCTPEMKGCRINTITFRLINYKGCVNIGIEAIELDVKATKEYNKETINLFVKPLVNRDHMVYAFEGAIVDQDREIIIQRLVKPYNKRLSDSNETGDMSRSDIFFDTEFNFRDGYFEEPGKPREGQVDGPHYLASPRCHQSNVLLRI